MMVIRSQEPSNLKHKYQIDDLTLEQSCEYARTKKSFNLDILHGYPWISEVKSLFCMTYVLFFKTDYSVIFMRLCTNCSQCRREGGLLMFGTKPK